MNSLYIKNNIYFRQNTWDENIWNSIHYKNEYLLDHKRLHWKGDVIDIGAHIGSFSHLMYENGANKIYSVEPDTDNFAVLQNNLSSGIASRKISIFNKCICYNSTDCYQQKFDSLNTGGNPWISDNATENKAGCVTLDELIDLTTKPILLKIDCEGCEFEIFKHCKNLIKVSEIIGEFHSESDSLIKKNLEDLGFIYSSHKTSSNLGLFAATRKDVYLRNQ
jgi:FkbM family methyltransferase